MNRFRSRKGFSLIELIVAIVVLGILTTLLISTGASAQRRARITAAMSILEDYSSAFNTVCMNHPGIMKDREDSWKSADGYKTKTAMADLVNYMNQSVDSKYVLIWDDTFGAYVSASEDGWGGRYILTEYPQLSGTTDGYDPTTGTGLSAMRFSIWSTGIDQGIIEDKKVSNKSVGVAFWFKNGNINKTYHGVEDGILPFKDYELKYN